MEHGDFRQLQAQQSESVIRHSLSRQVGVDTPLLQVIFFWMLPAAILAAMVCWAISIFYNLPWPIYPIFVISIGAIVLMVGGTVRVAQQDDWKERLIKTLESAFQMDFNGDGKVEQDEPETVIVDHRNADGTQGAWSETPRKVTRAKLQRFAKLVMQGRPITEKEWTKGPNKLFSQGEYDDFIAFMLDPKRNPDPTKREGWIRYKNRAYPNLGVELTDCGREILGAFAEMENNPSPTLLGRE